MKTKRTREYDDDLFHFIQTKFVTMSDELDQRIQDRDQANSLTILELRKDLQVESRRVTRLRTDVTNLKVKNRRLKRIIRMHHEMLSNIAEEHLGALHDVTSDESEPEILCEVTQDP